MKKAMTVVTGVVIDENYLDLTELTEAYGVTPEIVFELVEHGLLIPRGRRPEQWAFSGTAVHKDTGAGVSSFLAAVIKGDAAGLQSCVPLPLPEFSGKYSKR